LRDEARGHEPLAYATRYAVVPDTGRPYRFAGYEYLRQPLADPHPHIVVMKAAQLGWTVMACVRVFWFLDVRRTSTLVLMPTEADVVNFSAGRFAVMTENSPRWQGLFTDVSNVAHKRTRSVNLYLRGSGSRSRLKSVPVGYLTIDEYDEMYEGSGETPGSAWSAVALARERLSGHRDKHELDISTPRIPQTGIHAEFEASDRHHYFIRCPACTERQALAFEANVRWSGKDAGSASIVCARCGKPFTSGGLREAIASGEWVPAHPGRDARGYHLSQLYSPTVSVQELVRAFLQSQGSQLRAQEFHNSKLGLPYVAEGARIGTELIQRCTDPSRRTSDHADAATMGVDVGGQLHWEVAEWQGDRKLLVAAGTCESFEHIARLARQYNVYALVVDANPERRQARRLAASLPGIAWLCFYGKQKAGLVRDDKAATVSVHRTEMLDATLGRFRARTVVMPADLPDDYARHLQALVRRTEKDRRGEYVARYYATGDDHFAHAANYNEVAHQLLGGRPTCAIAPPTVDGTFDW